MPTPIDSNEDEFDDCFDPDLDGFNPSALPQMFFFKPEIDNLGYVACASKQEVSNFQANMNAILREEEKATPRKPGLRSSSRVKDVDYTSSNKKKIKVSQPVEEDSEMSVNLIPTS